MAGIELIDIHKTYRVDNREIPVLNGINLSLPAGRITVILGQSGCGKTTLLRLTGGLETADSGEIRWESAHKTAFVFQEPRLMPWLTVWENVVFGLSKKETDPGKIEAVIRTVGLSGFEKAYPAQLSGGMQQPQGAKLDATSGKRPFHPQASPSTSGSEGPFPEREEGSVGDNAASASRFPP